jgi:hypothetical protein
MNVALSESESLNLSIFSYAEELNLLSRWKVIPLGSLHNILPKKIHKTYSYRLADKLVHANVAHKVKKFRKSFHVLVPTKEALKCTNQNFVWSSLDKYCRSAFIASAFFELHAFRNKVVRFAHEEDGKSRNSNDLCPDFSLVGLSRISGNPFEAGVFFEARHSLVPALDTYSKMMKFLEDENFSVIILVFTTLDALSKCRQYYFESREHKYGKQLRDLICLVHINDYVNHPHELIKSYVYFEGEEGTLQELFA